MSLSGKEKVSILLSLLGSEGTESILRHLPEELIPVARANGHPPPSPEAIKSVISELKGLFSIQEDASGAPEEEKTDEEGLIPGLTSKKLAEVVAKESKETVAFLLSHPSFPFKRELLACFPLEEREEIQKRAKEVKHHPLSERIYQRIMEFLSQA